MDALTISANTGATKEESSLKFKTDATETKHHGDTTGIKVEKKAWTSTEYVGNNTTKSNMDKPQSLSSVHSKGFGSDQISSGKGPVLPGSGKTYSESELKPSQQKWKSGGDPF